MTSLLDEYQKKRAIAAFEQYLNAPSGKNDGLALFESYVDFDAKRNRLIDEELQPLVNSFLYGNVCLAEFKTRIDGLNKSSNYWGFRGMKGQMFFNMLVNAADDIEECTAELQAALEMPTSDEIAQSRLRTLISYVRRVGDDLVARGGTGYQKPRYSSVPFFTSYFWHVNGRDKWPVMYTTSYDSMTSLNLWQPKSDWPECYIQFTAIQKELLPLFASHTGMECDLYQLEHMFWFLQQNHIEPALPPNVNDPSTECETSPPHKTVLNLLPDSYAPPIVAVLPKLACPDAAITQAATNSGTSVARAFEKHINAAFTILGYETRLLGQGQGRQPDGMALAPEHSYSIIWDAKSRADAYSLGTDNRAIREYIDVKSRELRRQYRNIYFMIISGRFQSDFSDALQELKMTTDVKEVCLMEAEALLAIVEAYLKNPHDLSLGPDGLQKIFASPQGIITKLTIDEFLG